MSTLIWKRVWARKYAPLLASAFQMSFVNFKKFGIAPNKLFLPEGNLMVFLFEEKEFSNIVKRYSRFLKSVKISEYAKEYEAEFKDFLSYAKKLSSINISKFSKKELSLLIRRFGDRFVQSSEHQFYAFLVLEGLAADLEHRLSKTEQGTKILQDITTPYKDTKITRARLELIKLAKEKRWNAIKAYANKYAWLPVYEPLDIPWTEKDFLVQAKSIKNPKEEMSFLIKHNQQARARYKKYLSTIKDKQLRQQVEIVHYFSYLKEMRDDYRRQAYYLVAFFLKKIAVKIGISFNDLNYLTFAELASSVEKMGSSVSKKEINARQEAYAFKLSQGKFTVVSGKKAKGLGQAILKVASQEVKGSPAYAGVVRGKVSIIYHQGEFNKFVKGNVLVTPMTHPEFLQLMKNSKAIVTDEGGITCHAAIVSREMKIPCIIGTRNATRVLNDGDMVEVDANKGVVRKIKL